MTIRIPTVAEVQARLDAKQAEVAATVAARSEPILRKCVEALEKAEILPVEIELAVPINVDILRHVRDQLSTAGWNTSLSSGARVGVLTISRPPVAWTARTTEIQP
jgi:SH3-like domain-containing protein